MTAKTLEDVLTVWFGDDLASDANRAVWFAKDPAFDDRLREDFGGLYDQVVAQPARPAPTARTVLATVILLDQFARNMFRGTPKMYAADPLARQLVDQAVDAGHPDDLPVVARRFLWMPWMHSESLADQDRCVAAFEAMGPDGEMHLRYARQHRDIVARFGRFPHRNAILGRASTPEELRFLTEDGSSF